MARRRILIVAGAAAAVLVAGVAGTAWYLYSSVDSYVERVIEREGSQLTGTRVRVSYVHLALRSGTGVIRDLRVANPEGFSSGSAISIGEVRFAVDLASLRRNPIVVTTLAIEAPQVNYELNSDRKSNLDAIQRATNRPRGRADGGGTPGKRLRIDTLTGTNGRIAADTTAVGGPKQVLDLDPIRMSNVGGLDGDPPDKVGQAVVQELERTIQRAVERQVGNRVREEAGRRLRDRLGSIFNR